MSAAVSSTSSNRADQRTCASWLAPTTDGSRGLGVEAQRGGRLAARQRRDPDLEAGGHELRPGDGHQLPGLVGAEVDLPPAQATGSEQDGEQALQPGQLLGQVLLGAAVDQGDLDRHQVGVGVRAEHGQEPGVAAVGGLELHHQLGPWRGRHRRRPPLEAADDLGAGAGRGIERGAVEPGEHGLGRIDGGADLRGRRGVLDPAGGVGGDGVDHRAEHGDGDVAGVGAVEHGHGPGHGAPHLVDADLVGEGRDPLHHVLCGGAGLVALARPGPAAGPQGRDDRAAGDQLHPPGGEVPEPRDAPVGPLAALAGGHRDEPPEGVADGDGPGTGPPAARQGDRLVVAPPVGRRAGGGEQLGQLLLGGGLRAAARAPRHQAVARAPRQLELDLAGRLPACVLRHGGQAEIAAGALGQVVQRDGVPVALRLEVGHHLVPLLAGEATDRVELLLGVHEEAIEHRDPRGAVLLEQRELLRGRLVSGRGDGRVLEVLQQRSAQRCEAQGAPVRGCGVGADDAHPDFHGAVRSVRALRLGPRPSPRVHATAWRQHRSR
jgi:hypothetical protein